MHASIRPNLGPLFGVAETELAQKANPEGINQYTKGGATASQGAAGSTNTSETGNGSGPAPKIKPAFSSRAKVTIQQATEALKKQGYKLEHAGLTKDHQAKYKVTDEQGNTVEMTGKELTSALTGKAKKLDPLGSMQAEC